MISVRRILASALTLSIGFAIAGGLWWALLNVPESNVLALGMSGLLVLLIVCVAGFTIAMAIVPGTSWFFIAVRHALKAIPYFIAGLIGFGLIWWTSSAFQGWWFAHEGEINATILYRFGIMGTDRLHRVVDRVLWFVRWVIGLSIVVAAVQASMFRLRPTLTIRHALRPLSLLIAGVAVLFVTQVLWGLTYWRPEGMPANSVEVVFAVVKLGALYFIIAGVAAIVLETSRDAISRELPPGGYMIASVPPPPPDQTW